MFENTTKLQATNQIFCKIWEHNKISSNRDIKVSEPTKYVAMFENTTRLQPMGKKFKVLKPPKITKYVAMSENTTRWQAKGENLTYWSNQIRGNAWKYRTIPGHKIVSNGKTLNLLKTSDMWQCWKIAQCLKIPTKDVSHGNTTRFSATELSIFEGTTRLPATGKNLSYSIWSHQHGNVWKYHKIAGHGGTLKLLKPPNIWPYLRIHQVYHQRWNI